jgi:hypothetical protein
MGYQNSTLNWQGAANVETLGADLGIDFSLVRTLNSHPWFASFGTSSKHFFSTDLLKQQLTFDD